MKKLVLLCFSLFTLNSSLLAQSWHLLPNSPAQAFRHDDVWFINADTGWVVNVSGQIWTTKDGGNTWKELISQPTSFRCVSFFDSIHGVIGNLGPGNWAPTYDTNCLYITSDGGKTIHLPTIIGPKPKGICGLCKVNDTVIVGIGRFDGPPYFVRSTDQGKTWQSKRMSAYAGMLIDTYFTSPDTGFAVGGDDSIEGLSRSIILYTTDAGNTWTTKIKGIVKGNHCWKFVHTPNKVYYVSDEELYANDSLKFFKSLDAGATWKEYTSATRNYGFSQGIGFINDTIGWIGGDTYAITSTDGGNTFSNFSPSNLLINLNRMRFINDTLGYAVGQRVYKYCITAPNSVHDYADLSGYSMEQNVPNPFTNSTIIKYSIPVSNNVLIEVFDDAGRKIKTLVNEHKAPGTYSVQFSLPQKGNNSFICCMLSGSYGKRIKMVSVK